MLFGPFAQVADNAGDQFFQPMAPAEDLRSGQAATRQVRFERLDQATLFLGIQIALNGARAGEAVHATLPAGGLRLLEIEHGSAGRDLFATEGKADEPEFFAGLNHRHRAVGSSEIDAEIDRLLAARTHLFIIQRRSVEEIAQLKIAAAAAFAPQPARMPGGRHG